MNDLRTWVDCIGGFVCALAGYWLGRIHARAQVRRYQLSKWYGLKD